MQGFLIFLDYGGETVSIPSLRYSEIESFGSKRITTDFLETTEGIQEIGVTPKIENNNNIFICDKQTIKVAWENVGVC